MAVIFVCKELDFLPSYGRPPNVIVLSYQIFDRGGFPHLSCQRWKLDSLTYHIPEREVNKVRKSLNSSLLRSQEKIGSVIRCLTQSNIQCVHQYVAVQVLHGMS